MPCHSPTGSFILQRFPLVPGSLAKILLTLTNFRYFSVLKKRAEWIWRR
jgi:hypothetical protein